MLDFIDRTVIPFFLSLYDAVGYLGVAIAIGLETFVPIIPSEVIVPMAGWKVSQSAADPSVLEPLTNAPWSWLVVLLIATVGAVAGSLAGYLIGAWGGRPLLDRWGRYVHIKPDDLDRADAWFARYGDRAVFFARLVPLLRALINYPAGVARMPMGRFLFFSALGSLPWNAALLLGGYLLGENYKKLYEAVRPFELLIYVLVVVGVAYVVYRWLRGRSGSHAEAEGVAEVRRLVEALEAQVNNGGFDQLFFNSAGDEVAAMIAALERIGATRTAAIVRRACARFPGGMPPVDRNERQTVLLDTVNPDDEGAFEPEDDDFFAYEEDLAALVADFAGQSPG